LADGAIRSGEGKAHMIDTTAAASAMPHQAAVKKRSPLLDCAKGLAILAVVMSHAVRGVTEDGLLPGGFAFKLTDSFFYLFHVQLFLIISGYLGFPKADGAKYQVRRQISLAYIYLLWSAVSLTAWIFVGRPTGQETIAQAYLALLYAPIQHFWFLPTIMLGDALFYFIRRPWALFSALIVCLVFRLTFDFSYYGLDYYLFFFLLGGLIRSTTIPGRAGVKTGIAATVLFMIGSYVVAQGDQVATTIINVPLSLAGCGMAFLFARYLASKPEIARVLGFFGQRSLPIFLVHAIFMAASRISVVAILGPGWPVITLLLSFACALAGPIMLERIAISLGLERLAGFRPLLT
jgi:fucose 4-O-acetylase-like acetyltransferase